MLTQNLNAISDYLDTALLVNNASAMIIIDDERSCEVAQREALLDSVMGANRKRKSSEKIRKNRLPAQGLNLVARDESGMLIGSIRLWHICLAHKNGGFINALLLGPLAIRQEFAGQGIGSRLMVEAISRAKLLGHGAILLVGDADYYCRFGFCASKAANLSMPGPFERQRFQALELVDSWLSGATGVVIPSGEKIKRNISPAKSVA